MLAKDNTMVSVGKVGAAVLKRTKSTSKSL